MPTIQLILWSISTNLTAASYQLFTLTGNSLLVAFSCAVVVLLSSLVITYGAKLAHTRLGNWLSRISVLGYSVPGVVIAVGVLAPSTWLDHRIHYLLKPVGIETGLLFSGTIVALVFGLTVRFMALAFNPLDASFEKNCRNLDEASRTLGHSPLKTLIRINLPLLKPAILVAATLVFVDVIKELPLTLFLSPTNFDTLATRAYELAAKEEAVREAAPVALLVIAAGLIPVLFVNRLQKSEYRQS
ncbi:MAG: ABC transporter permease subunit [Calditrichota bacterium]